MGYVLGLVWSQGVPRSPQVMPCDLLDIGFCAYATA